MDDRRLGIRLGLFAIGIAMGMGACTNDFDRFEPADSSGGRSSEGSSPFTTGAGGAGSCVDGTKNGAETDVDCGGPFCAECENGEHCSNNSDCSDRQCADGFCCNDKCNGVCLSCSVPGDEGDCRPVPRLSDDPPECSGSETCDGDAHCKLAVGEDCNDDDECASDDCSADGVCRD